MLQIIRWGSTPLSLAAREGHKAVIELLLGKDANTNAKDDDLNTPLHWAARYGHSKVAGLLVDHGADVNALDKTGEPAWRIAAENEQYTLLPLLAKDAKQAPKEQHGRDLY